MQGMECNLQGVGDCKTNPPHLNPQKNNQMLRRKSEPSLTRKHSSPAVLLLLLWGIYTYAYQGKAPCFFTSFCVPFRQLCRSVLIHDPGLKCMFCSLLFGDKWLRVCVCVCASSLISKSMLYLLWLFNLACRYVWAFGWIYMLMQGCSFPSLPVVTLVSLGPRVVALSLSPAERKAHLSLSCCTFLCVWSETLAFRSVCFNPGDYSCSQSVTHTVYNVTFTSKQL